MKASRLFLLLMGVVFALSACAAVSPVNKETGEAALKQRINAAWQAKQAKKWGDVYLLSLAQFDDAVSRDDFIRSGKLVVKGFKIAAITIAADNSSADVVVCFDTEKMGFTLPGMTIHERWQLHDGVWFMDHNIKKTPF